MCTDPMSTARPTLALMERIIRDLSRDAPGRITNSASKMIAAASARRLYGKNFTLPHREYTKSHIAADLDYFSLLRPWSELAITRAFAEGSRYDDVFSSCNRNFRIRGERPAERW